MIKFNLIGNSNNSIKSHIMENKDICLVREDLVTSTPIKLSIGEVVIGRGPLLKCIDKRVSRNHGLLKLADDGSILLVSTHINPCYYTASGNEEKEIISQGKSITLQDGDRFALLPDIYCYRVMFTDNSKNEIESIAENKEKIRHSLSTIEGDKTWCESLDENRLKSHKTNNASTNAAKLHQTLEKDETVEKKTSCVCVRKRILPLWMLNENSSDSTPKKTKTIKSKKTDTHTEEQVKKQKQKQSMKKPDSSGITNKEEGCSNQTECTDKANKAQTSKKLHGISDDEESIPDTSNSKQENVQKAIEHEVSDKEESITDISNSKQVNVQKTIKHDISDNEQSDNEHLNDEQQESSGCTETADAANRNQQQNTLNALQQKSPNETKQKREPCKYGAACYRKNPQHREEFSHPDDEDFEDESDKPECPYGVSCYRKNPLHWQNFKHTTTIAKKKTQQQRKTKNKDERDYESDEDTYDEEDPFINNASSDDYQPTDSELDSESISDGDEEEGTKRMLKEAKKFIKKR